MFEEGKINLFKWDVWTRDIEGLATFFGLVFVVRNVYRLTLLYPTEPIPDRRGVADSQRSVHVHSQVHPV